MGKLHIPEEIRREMERSVDAYFAEWEEVVEQELLKEKKKSSQKLRPAPFQRNKSLEAYFIKGAGDKCKQGETKAKTDCLTEEELEGESTGKKPQKSDVIKLDPSGFLGDRYDLDVENMDRTNYVEAVVDSYEEEYHNTTGKYPPLATLYGIRKQALAEWNKINKDKLKDIDEGELAEPDFSEEDFEEYTIEAKEPRKEITPESFPKAEDLSKLKKTKNLGGSTGAVQVEYGGNLFVQKKGASSGHVQNEVEADNLYRVLGLSVPFVKLYDTDRGKIKLAEWIEGEDLGDYMESASEKQKQAMKEQIQQGFVIDALLGNWDVVGMGFDNIKVDKNGTAWRIDNGGALTYRARGELKTPKQFSEAVTEIETLRNPYTNPQSADIFGGITDQQIANQVDNLVNKKHQLLSVTPIELRDTLSKRIDWLKNNYGSKITPQQVAERSIYAGKGADWKTTQPDPNRVYSPPDEELDNVIFKSYGDNDSRQRVYPSHYPPSFVKHMREAISSMTAEEKDSVKRYSGPDYIMIGQLMRKCPENLDCLGNYNNIVENLDKAIAKAGKFERPITVWRDTGLFEGDSKGRDFLAVLQYGLENGEDIRIPGIKGSSMTPNRATGHGEIKLEIRAKSGLLTEDVSYYDEEQELIQGHNTRYRVKAIKNVGELPKSDWGPTPPKKIVTLEEV